MRPEEKAVDHIMSADAATRPGPGAAPLPIVLKIPWLASESVPPNPDASTPSKQADAEVEPVEAVSPAPRDAGRRRGRRSGRIAVWAAGCVMGVAAALVCDQSAWFHEAAAQLGFGRNREFDDLQPSSVLPPLKEGERDPRIPADPEPVQAVISHDEAGAATLAPDIIPIDDPAP